MAEEVYIDLDRCQGHARCWALAPGHFGIDEEGFGYVLDPAAASPEDESVRKAIKNCPERAIRTREAGSAP